MKNKCIGVDFDGTVVKHNYPYVGEDLPGAVETLKKLVNNNIKIILNTMRGGKELEDAINWFKEKDIPLYGINEHPLQAYWTTSPKIWADHYIDDAAIGAPLDENSHISWYEMECLLIKYNYLPNTEENES